MTRYSHSKLTTFKNCPLKYKLKYIDKIKAEGFEGIEAFMGSRVHDTLEKLYNDIKMCKEVSLEGLLDFFEKEWEKNWTDNVVIVNEGYTPENYKEIGKKCIKDYWNRHHPFDESKTIATEKQVVVDLGDGNEIVGYIDRLTEDGDGNYGIHDYKTSGSLPTQEQKDSDQQLAIYQIALQEMWNDVKSVKLVWHYLVFDKIIISERSKEDLGKLKKNILELIEEIENSTDFPPNKSYLCSWCEYQGMCPLMKHIKMTGEMEVNEYLNEPGVKLVNKYVELTDRKKAVVEEIEKELADVQEALIAYSKKEGVEVIRGNDKKLRIRVYRSSKFPGTSDNKRKELDELIKQFGKWMEVSNLNVRTLGKILEKPEEFGWSKELADKIKQYQKIEESYRMYLSKLSDREKFDGD